MEETPTGPWTCRGLFHEKVMIHSGYFVLFYSKMCYYVYARRYHEVFVE
jgi:hypothetical protein